MNEHQRMVDEFMKAAEQQRPDHFAPLELDGEFRISLMQEELNEFKIAFRGWADGDTAGELTAKERPAAERIDVHRMIDALCDLLYVTYGSAVSMGLDIEPHFKEVHRANMTKLVNGKIVRRPDGKILKPDSFKPPDHGFVLSMNAGVYPPAEQDSWVLLKRIQQLHDSAEAAYKHAKEVYNKNLALIDRIMALDRKVARAEELRASAEMQTNSLIKENEALRERTGHVSPH